MYVYFPPSLFATPVNYGRLEPPHTEMQNRIGSCSVSPFVNAQTVTNAKKSYQFSTEIFYSLILICATGLPTFNISKVLKVKCLRELQSTVF